MNSTASLRYCRELSASTISLYNILMPTFPMSPILHEDQLHHALAHIHKACHTLCFQTLHTYLPVAGNIGIFSHSEEEYEALTTIQANLTDSLDAVYGKYYRLHSPISIQINGEIPSAIYTHLYIRKPDPNKPQIGDLDFYLESKAYAELKQYVLGGTVLGARILPNRPELDLIELYDPKLDALGYVGDKKWV